MPIHVKDAGSWHQADMLVKNAGAWVAVQTGYVKDGGIWKPFYVAEVAVVAPTTLSTQNAATIFDNYETGLWASSKKKRLVVSSAIGPLVINSSFGGELTIEVQPSGSISGLGGAANSGAGGHALTITIGTGINLINNGTIRGGGGGGGIGGQGGQGVYYYTVFEPSSGNYYVYNSYAWNEPTPENGFFNNIYFGGFVGAPGQGNTTWTNGQYTYYRGDYQGTDGSWYFYSIRRSYTAAGYTSGGGGGAGGRGQGADGANAGGSPGAPGGTNAGTGGTGGTGGTYGNPGGTGSTGGSGNYTGGSAGASGGAAGRSVSGYNRVNYSGSGSLVGPTGST